MNQLEMNKFLDELKPYLDTNGFVTQSAESGGDGGDSAHRFGLIVYCLNDLGYGALAATFYHNVKGYEVGPGMYRRHPDSKKWYSDPRNFSRDQEMMLLMSFVASHDKQRIHEAFHAMLERKGFHQNIYPNYVDPRLDKIPPKTPDILTLTEVSTFLRGAKAYLFYPIVMALDLSLPFEVLFAGIDDYRSKLKGKRTDQFVMMVPILRETQKNMVFSPGAWLARKLLKLFDWKGSINYIFAKKEWNDPPIHEILIPVGEKL